MNDPRSVTSYTKRMPWDMRAADAIGRETLEHHSDQRCGNTHLRSPEVRSSDGPKPFLASCVPNLNQGGGFEESRLLGNQDCSGATQKRRIKSLTCSLMRFPSNSMFLILKSIPMVVINVGENESLAYLSNRHVFPTPVRHRQEQPATER